MHPRVKIQYVYGYIPKLLHCISISQSPRDGTNRYNDIFLFSLPFDTSLTLLGNAYKYYEVNLRKQWNMKRHRELLMYYKCRRISTMQIYM